MGDISIIIFANSWLSSKSKCVKRFHFLSLLKLHVAMWLSLADKTWVEVVYVTSGWKYLIAGSYLSSASSPATAVEEEVSCKCSSVERLKWSGLLSMNDGCPGETHISAIDFDEARSQHLPW